MGKVRKAIRFLNFIFWNLLIFTITFEFVCRVFLSGYLDERHNKIIRRYNLDYNLAFVNHFSFDDSKPQKIPHPYLAYNHYFGKRQRNHIDKRAREDHLAIFGGSVAENFYYFQSETGLLQESLKDKELPGLGKKLSMRNYAIGGYKQPQQLIASILFSKKLKIAINIEGYNEVSIDMGRVFPHYYPMFSVSELYFSGMESWDLYTRAGRARLFQKKLGSLIKKNWPLQSIPTIFKLLYLLKEKSVINLEHRLNRRYSQKEGSFEQISTKEKVIYWLEKSCEQQNHLADKGVHSYFFFQPVPYVPESKKLTAHERQMIENEKKKF